MKGGQRDLAAAVALTLKPSLSSLLPSLRLVAYIDRSNIGNAKTAGMNADLGISDIQYRLVTIIFVISYILFQWLLLFYVSHAAPWHLYPPSPPRANTHPSPPSRSSSSPRTSG